MCRVRQPGMDTQGAFPPKGGDAVVAGESLFAATKCPARLPAHLMQRVERVFLCLVISGLLWPAYPLHERQASPEVSFPFIQGEKVMAGEKERSEFKKRVSEGKEEKEIATSPDAVPQETSSGEKTQVAAPYSGKFRQPTEEELQRLRKHSQNAVVISISRRRN